MVETIKTNRLLIILVGGPAYSSINYWHCH